MRVDFTIDEITDKKTFERFNKVKAELQKTTSKELSVQDVFLLCLETQARIEGV